MELFLIVFCVLGLLIFLMSIGVIFGKKPISGSCGGMTALGMDVACDVCKGDKNICETETNKAKEGHVSALSYNALKE